MSNPFAAWYPDPYAQPGASPSLRWWDGHQWTGHTSTPVGETASALAQAAAPSTSRSPLDLLAASAAQAIRRDLRTDETPLFVVQGLFKEALVACDHRCLVVKTGFMTGNSFGARVTSFSYVDIQAIQTRLGVTGMGYIEIVTAGFPSIERSYWANSRSKNVKNPNVDPAHAPNCLTTNKRSVQTIQPYIRQLEDLVRSAHSPPTGSGAAEASVSSQLESLVSLHRSGALTDAEFGAAKARLLGTNP